MCLAAFIFGLLAETQKNGYRFVLAFNREEFYARPAKPASFWPKNCNVIGGLDMVPGKEGGTWLAMSKTGRLAMLLNIDDDFLLNNRKTSGILDPAAQFRRSLYPGAKRRGSLVKDFVEGSKGCEDYLNEIALEGHLYNGFNLVTVDLTKEEIFYYSNKSGNPPQRLEPGSHGVSNTLLDAPWSKTTHAKDALNTIITNMGEKPKERVTDEILKVLSNDIPLSKDCPLDEISLSKEELYSALPELVCVKYPTLGTRSQTVILIDAEGGVMFTERYLKEPIDSRNRQWEINTVTFSLED